MTLQCRENKTMEVLIKSKNYFCKIQTIVSIYLVVFSEGIVANLKKEIVIAGFFPVSDKIEAGAIGRGVRPAVKLALDMINNNTKILRDYELKMTWNDTGCDMARATKLFFDMMDENTTKVMLFGDACSNVTGPLARISKWWDMWQLSYADTDPKLSDRSTYSNFFRTVPSDSDFNPARLAILKHFNWTKVGTIYQDPSVGPDRYAIAHNRMIQMLHDRNEYEVKVESFLADPDTAVFNLKKNDSRIILGYFDHNNARKIFCSAYRKGMYGEKYQWILTGDYPKTWWKVKDKSVPCTTKQIQTAINGYMSTEALTLISSKDVTESGLTSHEYQSLYDSARGNEYSKYHGYAFDGIWVIAKAVDGILQHSSNISLNDDTFKGKVVASALNETSFLGVTGKVQFDGADRIGHVMLEQFQGNEMVTIGEYQRSSDNLQLLTDDILWIGLNPPLDRNLVRREMQRVSIAVYAVICVISGLGIVMASIFLVINIIYRDHRYIKMSSPNMNNMIVIGCMMSYISIFLLGTDGGVLPAAFVQYVCAVRSWVLAVGFSLSFGAMFTKTWRVHAIFTNIKLNKKIIKDYKLFIMVCVLVVIDAGILGTWQVIDPLQRATKELSSQVAGDYTIIPIIEYCTSMSMEVWLGILYAYKGLLLVFGCFLAWETRQVTIPALNDSKYIGMSVYNVVIMCICGAAVSFVIKDQPNPAFIIISLFIIFCTTITLCLVFIPKLHELRKDPLGDNKRMRATLRRKGKKNKTGGQTIKQKIRDVADENRKYREIINQKSLEIKNLLEQLGEDSSNFEIEFKPAVHRKIMQLRVTDQSPSKLSTASSVTDNDNVSTFSDASGYTSTWNFETPPIKQRRLLRSTKSMTSTDTSNGDSIEHLENCRKIKLARLNSTHSSNEDDCDPFGGVYLGPSESSTSTTVTNHISHNNTKAENNDNSYLSPKILEESKTKNSVDSVAILSGRIGEGAKVRDSNIVGTTNPSAKIESIRFRSKLRKKFYLSGKNDLLWKNWRISHGIVRNLDNIQEQE